MLAGCGGLNVGIGAESPPQTYLALRDPGAAPAPRATPLVPTLMIQALPADALADTAGIAYARRPHEYAYYQLASWTERPVRQLPRLLLIKQAIAGESGGLQRFAQLRLRNDADLVPRESRNAITHCVGQRNAASRIRGRRLERQNQKSLTRRLGRRELRRRRCDNCREQRNHYF